MAVQAANPIMNAARALLKIQWTPPAAAVHLVTVQSPDGASRTFRFATETADIPAQAGERVTFVSAPFKNSAKVRAGAFEGQA